MRKLILADAVKLKSVLSKRIQELEAEMDLLAFVEIEKGSEIPNQVRNLAAVEKELEEVRSDFRLLDKLMYKANYENEVSFEEQSLAIVEAIELATQLRARARKYKQYGISAKEEMIHSYSEAITLVRVATFDPEVYRIKGIETERQANRLSNLINAKNYQIELDFDSDKYF
ncbi:hypothetical protein ACIQD3_01860 [Peribacillus loiseleuriae]|uniref:Uncharacterized protein n=1 Tax=Peribacillus loiseleuriae TaxID=1679170 RepID=A0A0K9GW59_9BACI|nr:hypothetical protein [Peribacillus loiseleuriae]KMY50890.1 hypothetical protein AC625_16295 [Peribacillus loiseleuriae]